MRDNGSQNQNNNSQKLKNVTVVEKIRKSKQRILQLWEDKVLQELSPSVLRPNLILLEDLTYFLDELSTILANAKAQQSIPQQFAMRQIDKESRAEIYSVDQLMSEYSILRGVLFAVLEEHGILGRTERDTIIKVLDQKMKEAGEWYAKLSGDRFRATFELAAVGVAHVALDGRWIRVNKTLCDFLGYTKEEFMQITFQDITHPDDLRLTLLNVERIIRGEIASYSMHKRYLKKDGACVWAKLTVSLVCNPHNDPEYFISVIEDISNYHDIETQLNLALAMMQLGRWEWNSKTGVVFSDKRGNEIFGYQSTAGPRPIDDYKKRIIPEDKRRVNRIVKNSLRQKKDFGLDFRIQSGKEETKWVSMCARPSYDADGKPSRILGIVKTTQANETQI